MRNILLTVALSLTFIVAAAGQSKTAPAAAPAAKPATPAAAATQAKEAVKDAAKETVKDAKATGAAAVTQTKEVAKDAAKETVKDAKATGAAAATQTKEAAKTAPAVAAKVDDAGLTSAVKDKLSKTPSLKAASISVAVKDGVAMLTGKVKNGGLKGVATNVVKRVSGVKSVDNQLEVEKAAAKDSKKKK